MYFGLLKGCRREAAAARLMAATFDTTPPCIANSVMKIIETENANSGAPHKSARIFSLGHILTGICIFTGLVLLFSFAGSFVGQDFTQIASLSGQSFLLPFGITAGGIITIYIAFFVGTHLELLSRKFSLGKV